jgi:hypothetical protein
LFNCNGLQIGRIGAPDKLSVSCASESEEFESGPTVLRDYTILGCDGNCAAEAGFCTKQQLAIPRIGQEEHSASRKRPRSTVINENKAK